MSQKDAVRQLVRLSGRQHRSFQERLMVRIPPLARLSASAFMRLSPRSRLRRALLAQAMGRIYEAFNRGDMPVFLLLGNDPDVELHAAVASAGIATGVDLQPVYHGHSGLLEYRRRWLEAWEELRIELESVIDCGGTIVVLMRMHCRGRGSGIEVEHPFAQLVTLGRHGLAVRVESFFDHQEALEAAGLSE
jgi:ketosteroid isomerase-like protein